MHDFVGRGPLEIAGEFVHGPPETKPLLRCPPQSRLIDAAAADTLADLPAYLRVDGRVIDGARVPARRSRRGSQTKTECYGWNWGARWMKSKKNI